MMDPTCVCQIALLHWCLKSINSGYAKAIAPYRQKHDFFTLKIDYKKDALHSLVHHEIDMILHGG